MPVTPTYPGVYIQELASDVRTIVPVETATAAFVGRALRGPVNRPVTIFSFAEFEQVFGGLWLESQLGFAVSDFFLNGGAKAIVVRVYRPATAKDSNQGLPAHSRLPLLAGPGADAVAAARKAVDASLALGEAEKALADAGQALADAEQALADAEQAVAAAGDDEAKVAEATAKRDAAQATVAEATAKRDAAQGDIPIAQALLQRDAAAVKSATPLEAAAGSAEEVAAANKLIADAQALVAAEEALAEARKGNPRAPSAGRDAARSTAAQSAKGVALFPQAVELKAVYEGSWGNRLTALVTREGDGRILESLERQYAPLGRDAFFNVRIRDLQTGVEEYYPNVTLVESPRRLDRVLAAQSGLARMAGPASPGAVIALPLTKESEVPDKWWEAPGARKVGTEASDGAVPRVSDFTGAAEDDEAKGAAEDETKKGLLALDDADIFNMLCIPPYERDGDGFEDVPAEVFQAAATYCEKRRAILLVDPPKAWTSWSKAKDGFPIQGLSPMANAAVYFPRIKKANPLRDNHVEDFAPCGAIAGVIARTDFRRGVWKAPAGLEATLRGVAGFSVPLGDNENGQLNPLGINCLRVMPAAGPVVWGARTMEGDDRLASQWKYLPVRRMALWIEETLYRSTHWAVFEPNDEPLWSSLRLNIGNFMGGLFRQGAFQGRTPAEAFFVKCDASTTTQADIDRGIVNVIVGFAPLKPAEFVIISIKQITNQGAAA